MSYVPRPQEIYKHFKGNLYQIITVAEHSETGEKLVIYQALYGDYKIYARELGMFTGKVDRSKYPNAAQEYRFELQNVQTGEPDAKPLQASQPGTATVMNEVTEEEANLDPLILEFLDANDYESKLNVLAALHHRITDDMITIMAVASDVEVEEGNLEDRYVQLRNCLLTLDKYESSRMR